jgi:predicted RecB family nuclease
VNPVVPIWKGARPYQKVPFQFSRHRLDAQGRLTHRAFLDLSGEDPSRPLIQALLAACGESGPIFVYSRFEKTVINDLAKRYAEHATALKALAKRLVDLHRVAAARYYHPDQHGSWSIKAVLPTIAPDLDYAELDGVQDGNMAMKAYQEAIDPATTEARREEIRRQLLAYCKLDTRALVRLWKYFSGQPAGKPRP